MTVTIAGHFFNTVTHGERCQRESCNGVGSLVELCAMADYLTDGDTRIAHYGMLTGPERAEIISAAKVLRENLERAWVGAVSAEVV